MTGTARLAIPLLLALGLVPACGRGGMRREPDAAAAAGHPGLFRDVTRAAGIDFRHSNGVVRASYPNILQTTGSGCGMLDYDQDGLLDLYLVDSAHAREGGNRLYRNLGNGRFEDVTTRAGVRGTGYGMGCAVGDYNADGHPDLYVTNYGSNILFRNNGDGTFTDVTREMGAGLGGWSTAAAFFDADGDGDLDLYVGRYVVFDETSKQLCEISGVLGGCNPSEYTAQPDVLLINKGGRYVDGTAEAGIVDPNGRSLGVLVDDYDQDGLPDVFVANDRSACYLFHNMGKGHFKEVGVPSGVGYGTGGRPLAAMGCDWGDYDADGQLDLAVGSFEGEPEGLWRGLGGGLFLFSTTQAGIIEPTSRVVTFGLGFFDYDRDGDLDLAQVNGHVHPLIGTIDPEAPYHQPRQLFENQGGGRFSEVAAAAAPDLVRPAVGRGLAFGDVDNDGRIDLLVSNNGEPAVLLRNEVKNAHHWLLVRLEHPRGEAYVLGGRITVSDGARRWTRSVRTAYSYAGANDPRVFFGFGGEAGPVSISIRWPRGETSRVTGVGPDQVVTLSPSGLTGGRAGPVPR